MSGYKDHERRLDYMRRWVQKRVDSGICINCGKPSDRPGMRLCTACGKANSAMHRAMYAARVKAGECAECGLRPLEPGRTRCRECLDKNRLRAKKCSTPEKRHARYDELKAQGICVECRRRKARQGYVKCQICQEYNNLMNRERRKREAIANAQNRPEV